jgi:glutaredoxin 3
MAEVVIYTAPLCGYCARAKSLLKRKGAAFQEIDISLHPEKRDEMIERSGGRNTVPQVFINGRHYGGCDDIHALDAAGELDPLLGAAA